MMWILKQSEMLKVNFILRFTVCQVAEGRGMGQEAEFGYGGLGLVGRNQFWEVIFSMVELMVRRRCSMRVSM